MPTVKFEADDHDGPTCPTCGGPVVYMGELGDVIHFRCRNCGSECSITGAEWEAHYDA